MSHEAKITKYFSVVPAHVNYHETLDAILMVTNGFITMSSPRNIFVYYKDRKEAKYMLKVKFRLLDLVYICGEFRNDLVGLSTPGARPVINNDTKARVFDLNGINVRDLILPYDKINTSFSDSFKRFQYLKLITCEESAFIELTVSMMKSRHDRLKGGRRSSSSIHWYRIVDMGLFLKLQYVRDLGITRYGRVFARKGDLRFISHDIDLTSLQCFKNNLYEFSFRPFTVP
jgi:hypothetical protein